MKNFSTTNDQLKVLLTLMNSPSLKGARFIINDDFFRLFRMNRNKVMQALNALSSHRAIDLVEHAGKHGFPMVIINQEAYAYIHELKSRRFAFWLPTLLSVIALIKSFDKELVQLLKLLAQLLR